MKHDIQAYLVPANKVTYGISVGNAEYDGDVPAYDYTIQDQITYYVNNGAAKTFLCCEIKPESSSRQEFSRNVFGVDDRLYINADRDLSFKEDDIVFLPFGKYRIVATDNQRVRPIKNGFYKEFITINIELVKQND